MNVLHVITDTNVGGAGRYLLAMLKAVSEGWPGAFGEMAVACPPGMLADELRSLGVPVVSHRGRDISFSAWLTAELVALMRRLRPGLVHTHACLSARIAATLLGIPVVYTKHSLDPNDSPPESEGRPKRNLKKALTGFASRILADRVIAVSGAVALSLRRSGVPAPMIVTIYNGVDIREYLPAGVGPAGTQESRPLVVGTVARLHRDKGLDVLVEAARMVRDALCGMRFSGKSREVRFVVAGDGPEKEFLAEKIDALGLGHAFKLAGHVRDVPEFLRHLDLFVLPSRTEALGLSILEAMASGLAVVATRVGGIPEVVIHGETGLLVPPESPERLCEAVLFLLSDPEVRLAMGRKGRRRAENMFDIRKTAEKTLELYREMCTS